MNTALQFSGGKDSLACLYMYRKQWDNLTVVWVNTGAAYPEVIEYMQGWKKKLPNFVEIKTDQPGQIDRYGWPSDVVPLRYTAMANVVDETPPYLIQGWIACCSENIWMPMYKAMHDLGVKRVIRGQRNEERRKGSLRNSHVVDGIEYVYPIETWTREEVFAYLRKVKAEIPEYYAKEDTSRDCWDCTAFLDENRRRIENLPEFKREIVIGRLHKIAQAVKAESQWNPAYA
jgi:phosphoadenosine phosphosulfate reductase